MKVSGFLNNNQRMHQGRIYEGLEGIIDNVIEIADSAFFPLFCQINFIGQPKCWRANNTALIQESADKTHLLTKIVIEKDCFFEVTDITEDKSIIDKYINVNNQNIRYFSGMPIVLSDGNVLGCISLMASKPYLLEANKKLILQALAKNIATHVEQHLENIELDNKLAAFKSRLAQPSNSEHLKVVVNSDLDGFLHRAVHDLKSPLNAIKNVISWIEEDINLGSIEDNENNFSIVNNSVSRMEQLLTDLRIYSEIGREIYSPEKMDLKVTVIESSKHIPIPNTFKVNVESCEIELPKIPFLFVINHLILNAIKHHDRYQGVIDISCKNQSVGYQISVSDDGPGIPKIFQDKVFEPFQKLKSKDEVEGTGLGLAMVRKTLDQYSAKINGISQEGSGTTFIIDWPKVKNDK